MVRQIPDIPVLTLFAVVALFLLASCQREQATTQAPGAASPPQSFNRIVSLAPSATEVVFALGLGDRVVGITRYCTYPPETAEVTKVGGFLDPNLEAVLRLEPDAAVVLDVHGDLTTSLTELGIATIAVNHRTLDGILESIAIIGERCGATAQADKLLSEIRAEMDNIREKTQGRPRPRVLLSAGRGYESGRLEEVYAAGQGQWYDDIIEMAGGRNAFQDEGVMFPALSGEGLVRLNPEVIIEMASDLDELGLTEADVIDDWNQLKVIDAVRNGRVYVLTGDYVKIPGPRFVRILEDVARILHPEAFGEST